MTGNNTSAQHVLLGEYTLGLLSPNEIAQAHALLGADTQAVASALAWENSLLELTDLLPPVDPSPLLLQRIQNNLGHDTSPTPASLYRKPAVDAASPSAADPTSPKHHPLDRPVVPKRPPAPAPRPTPVAEAPVTDTIGPASDNAAAASDRHAASRTTTQAASVTKQLDASHEPPRSHGLQEAISTPPTSRSKKPGSVGFWRLSTVVFALVALALGLMSLMPVQPVEPPVTIVQVAPTQAAILQAPGHSSTPAWVVTVDPQGNVLMRPKVHSDIAADASVQLWTHSSTMPAPRSLGLIDPNQPVTIPATLMGKIGPDQIFEMTLEPAGGSTVASPSGPVLFIGRIVTFGQPAPPPPAVAPEQSNS